MRNNKLGIRTIFLFSFLALGACGKASFDPYMDGLHENPSVENSTITLTDDNVADGITPATISLQIRSASDLPLQGVTMEVSVTGSDNVIVPCTPTDIHGLSTCKVYSTRAEHKVITIWGMIKLSMPTTFTKPRLTRTVLSIVSGSSVDTLPSGRRIIATAGIVETNAAQKDANGVIRLYSSVLGSVIGDD